MARTSRQSPEERLEAALARVLAALPAASPRKRAFLLKRAGDVCVAMDERRKALGWYGRAVDQLLELGDAAQAALLCRLIVYVQPEAVRARCTLTWIALGTGEDERAAENLAAYVDAARHAGQTALATQQLGWMFAAAPTQPLRERVVAGLRALGEPAHADALAAQLTEAPPAPLPPAQLWARVLEATIGPPATPARTAAP